MNPANAITTAEDWVPIKEAAARGFASRKALSLWVREGKVRAVRTGNECMIPVADLDAMIAARKTFNPDDAVRTLAKRIAAIAPAMTDEQKQHLSMLLSA